MIIEDEGGTANRAGLLETEGLAGGAATQLRRADRLVEGSAVVDSQFLSKLGTEVRGGVQDDFLLI